MDERCTEILQVKQLIRQTVDAGNVQYAPAEREALLRRIPVQVGAAEQPVILRADRGAELGGPDPDSFAATLWTADRTALTDGAVTVIGPDLSESEQALPFGQLLLVSGDGLSEQDERQLLRPWLVTNRIEGFFLRSTPQYHWACVSKRTIRQGLTLHTLGFAFQALYRQAVPGLSAMEVIFVTDPDALAPFAALARRVAAERQAAEKAAWAAELGELPACDGVSCSACASSAVCDAIRAEMKNGRWTPAVDGGQV